MGEPDIFAVETPAETKMIMDWTAGGSDVDPYDVDPYDVDPYDVDPYDLDPYDLDPYDLDDDLSWGDDFDPRDLFEPDPLSNFIDELHEAIANLNDPDEEDPEVIVLARELVHCRYDGLIRTIIELLRTYEIRRAMLRREMDNAAAITQQLIARDERRSKRRRGGSGVRGDRAGFHPDQRPRRMQARFPDFLSGKYDGITLESGLDRLPDAAAYAQALRHDLHPPRPRYWRSSRT